jgi:uncharacterized membrane protein (DUF2068 family)
VPDEPLSTLDRAAARSADRGPSTAHKTAAVLNVLNALFTIVWSLPVLQGGAADSDQVPYPVVIFGFVLAVLCLVSSYGIWKRQRWGVVLTIVLNAVSFISGAPGILFGDSAFLVVGSVVGCALNLAVIYLLLRRGSTRGTRA